MALMAQYLNPALDPGDVGSSRPDLGSTSRQLLDGIEFRLSVFWRPEVIRVPFQFDNVPPPLVFGDPGIWVIDLALADGTTLVAGQFARNGVNILGPFVGDSRFPGGGLGQIVAWDLSGDQLDPGREDLVPGSPRRLFYRTAAEVAAA